MNIYIPEEYFKAESINGYTAETAPIFFPNQIGGYMPAAPASTKSNGPGGMPPLNGQQTPRGERPDGGNGMLPMGGGGPMGDGGPMGGKPMGEGRPKGAGGPQGVGPRQSTVLVALSKGYIVASAGVRGRTTKDQNGIYTGKAPAAIVDLKAAVRYLKYNDKVMPGDANKIISNGTSAGGALSALLGTTGNNSDYTPYLDRGIGCCQHFR